MLDEILINNTISEDEVILMIRKGNERAEQLFFSYYETIMGVETNIFRKKYKLATFDRNDILQEVKLNLIDALKLYNFKEGKFYFFFIVIMHRALNKELKEQTSGFKDSRNNLEFDDNKVFRVDENFIMNDSIGMLEYEDLINKEKNEYSKICIKLWSEGYTYKEISEKINISIPTVNYCIRKGLEDLKNVLKKY